MAKKYIVRLTEDDRATLDSLVRKGKIAGYKRLHARILLKADISALGEGGADSRISEAFGVSIRTAERVGAQLVEQGLAAVLERAKPCRTHLRVPDGENEAHLIALACSDAPEGRSPLVLTPVGSKNGRTGLCEQHLVRNHSTNTQKNELKPWQK